VGDGSGLAKRRRRLGKKKEGLSSFSQKARGMTERGMKKVVARSLWQLLWPSENGSFGWSWKRNFKVRGGDGFLLFFFFFVKIGKILGLPMCHPFKILRSSID
jgi:hypothetical protein